MSYRILAFLILNILATDVILYFLVKEHRSTNSKPGIEIVEPPIPYTDPETVIPPPNYTITTPVPSFLPYAELVPHLKTWEQEAPELADVATYGKSSRGLNLYYIRVRNEREEEPKPVVLITGAIHGNEPWSTTSVMGYVGTLLDQYGDDDRITQLINEHDIYFVPVISPDTYPQSRHVDGVDPNRDYPTLRDPNKLSVPPVRAIQQLFLEIRPKAAISGHTFGRVVLHPWGDSNQACPNYEDYQRVAGQLARLCQYGLKPACSVYGRPIIGTEVDWYYRNGAFSTLPNGKKIHRGCFSVVVEFGTHQQVPTDDEIMSEFKRTFQAFLYFIQEAPKVEIWWDEQGNPVNADGTPKISGWKAAA